LLVLLFQVKIIFTMQVKITKLPGSCIEIEGELTYEEFAKNEEVAIKNLSANIELPGFRKDHIPKEVALKNIAEARILEEMAELAMPKAYMKILEENKIDAIGRPEIVITKIAKNNPLGFKIKTAVLPEIKLPDYKDIAKKIISVPTEVPTGVGTSVGDEELENTIMDIRKSRAPKVHTAEEPLPNPLLNKEREKGEVKKEPDLPPFDDEFVKALGPFKNVEDFKIKLKENIKLEKETKEKEKTRLKIMEKIIDGAEIEVPEILVQAELEKILYRMESDITQMGLKFEDYLKHLNKTKEDLKKEFHKDAEKKAKLGLILHKISEVEKITADPEQVKSEVAHILEHYKETDPTRARLHAENVLTNEKVFQFLENIQ